MFHPLTSYVLITARRDWLYLIINILLVANIGLSYFLGSNSFLEERQMRIVFISSISRFIIIFGIILFSSFHIYRSYENKEIEYILAKSISRSKFIIIYWLSFAILSFFLILPITIFLLLIKAPIINSLVWSLSLLVECMIVSAFSLIATIILKNAVVSILSTVGFYILSRMMGFFIYAIHKSTLATHTIIHQVMSKIIFAVSLCLPRLDLFGQSMWLIDNNHDLKLIGTLLLQSLIYIPVIIFIAIIDFNRKEL